MALPFNIESWIWYVFATGIIIARLVSRMLLFRSVKGLQADDWVMGLFVIASYTVLIVIANDQAEAQSNLLPPGFDLGALTAQQIANRRYGSKIVVIVEQMQIAVIWACKGCLLIMYHRLTRMAQHRENIAIKMLAVYVILGYVIMEILYFTAWCRPFSEYWAVPTNSSQCNALINHRITKAVFNISSDVIMLCIALPMFIRSLLPVKRKLILCGIFSLGVFVIAASILNSYYSFKNPYRPGWIAWYIRESSTAILVANLPFTWTLLRNIFNLGAFDEEHPPPPTYHSSRTAGGRRTARVHNVHTTPDTIEKQPSPTSSSVSRTTDHAVSLITSITGGRHHTSPSPAPTRNTTSPNSSSAEKEQELRDAAIQPLDFAPPPPLEAAASSSTSPTTAFEAEISFQQALAESSPPLSPSTSPSSLAHHRLPSPHPTHQIPIRTHLIPDGTGGFHPAPTRQTSPPSTSTSSSPTHSRRPSIPSTSGGGKRPMSPVPSVASTTSAATGATGATGGGKSRSGSVTGGGRSARDRRARARMST